MASIDPLDEGSIYWRGVPLRREEITSYRSYIMYMRQHPAMWEGTVEENLRLPFTYDAHASRTFDKQHVLELLAPFERDQKFLSQETQGLSGGEVQIVALIRILQLSPIVLLLDEPTSALDPQASRQMEYLLTNWFEQAPLSRSLVWVGHDSRQAQRMATRFISIQNGQLIE